MSTPQIRRASAQAFAGHRREMARKKKTQQLKKPNIIGVGLCFNAHAQDGKKRVFITDSQSWQVTGSAGGSNGKFGAYSSGGARPQNAEIYKTFGKLCPGVIVTNIHDKADYVVTLDHEGGKAYLRKDTKVVVFGKDGDMIFSNSTRSVGGAVEGA